MPRIRQYTSETGPQGLPPSRAAGASDFGNTGLSSLGDSMTRTADFLQERAVQEDVSNVRTSMAKARADWTIGLQERLQKATPGDAGFASNFSAELDDYLEKTRDTVQTKHGNQVFNQMAAELRGHFVSNAVAGQAALAGKKAVLDYGVTLDAGRNTLLSDPTQHGAVLKAAIEGLTDPNGPFANMPAAERARLAVETKKQLSLSAVQGLIQNGAAELALRQLKGGAWDKDLDADGKVKLVNEAEAAIERRRTAVEHDAAAARKVEKDRIDSVNVGLMNRFNAGQLRMRDVEAAGLPAFGEGGMNTWRQMFTQQAKDWADKPARTAPATFNELRARVDLPPGDPRKLQDRGDIWAAYGKGLSKDDATWLENRLSSNKTETGQRWSAAETEAIRNLRPQLDRSTLAELDETGGERVQAFTIHLRDKADQYRKAGKDPYLLLRKGTPDYIGLDIPAFQTPAQRLQATMSEVEQRAYTGGKPRPSLKDIFNKGGK